jgi:PhoPQ-activated pathogenicity-related protein
MFCSLIRHVAVLVAVAGFSACLSLQPLQAGLHEYLSKPDAAYAWKLKTNHTTPAGKVFQLLLTSQTWQGMVWEHQIQIYQPNDATPGSTMLLMVTGGSGKASEARLDDNRVALNMEVARRLKMPYAVLTHIPNQPLLGDLKEDKLIAETFVRFLNTKDENWPLLFPMTKSVLRAMDAVQAFAEQEWKKPVKQFVITGGSKRGWTSWFTGATGDPRVMAIAPMVIDTLNMKMQLPNQVDTLGAYSEMIGDYTERKLIPMPDTPEAQRLWSMVDPWVYRDKLTMPKLLINGNNDPYWSTDSLNLYWDDLKGDKWVIYVPNAGHDLRQKDKPLLQQMDYAFNGIAAFTRLQMQDKPLPRLTWKHGDAAAGLRLEVTADPPPKGARLWVAHAQTRDFRKAKWVEHPAKLEGGKAHGEVKLPKEGYLAFYGELDYDLDGLTYHLSTQLRLSGPGGKK